MDRIVNEFTTLSPVLQALLATCFTWGVTALGAAWVFMARDISRRTLDAMLGFAAGVMIAASFWSLLAPAIRPDLALVSFERPKRADEAKTKVLELAAQLRHGLDGRYRRYAESSDPEVVTRVRQAGGDYLFAVNDHREFGDYVGHHGLVMENGVPARATLTVRRADGHVYDLVAHRPIQAARAGGKLTFEAGFGPGQGRLFLITSRPPAAVRVAMPDTARLGESVAGAVSVVDAEGKPVVAVLPVQLAITDPAGRPAEGSGCYAARDGRLTVKLDLAPNDRPGVWSIRVDDLAAGLVGEAWLRVTR